MTGNTMYLPKSRQKTRQRTRQRTRQKTRQKIRQKTQHKTRQKTRQKKLGKISRHKTEHEGRKKKGKPWHLPGSVQVGIYIVSQTRSVLDRSRLDCIIYL